MIEYTVDPSAIALRHDFRMEKWTKLTEGHFDYPCWSRDGRYIYFNNGAMFVRVRISDGKVEDVASLKGVRRTAGPFGQ